MNAIQQLANRVKSKADVSRWLSRPNNGTTDAYQQHLDSIANQFRQTERTPAEILRDLEREQFKVREMYDEYHLGQSDAPE